MKEDYEYQIWKTDGYGDYELITTFHISKTGLAIMKWEELRKDCVERMITNYTYELIIEEKEPTI